MAKQADPVDPALDAYAKGLAALQRKQWAQAAEHLEKAIAETDQPELRDRARQLLAASREQAGEAAGGKGQEGDEDPFLLAVFEKNRGNLKSALEICRKEGRDQKEDRFAYLTASIHAVEGRTEEAAQVLTRAVELNSKNRVHAYHDPDFADLRRNRDYRHIFGLT